MWLIFVIGFFCVAPQSVYAEERIDIGGTVVIDGKIDISTLNYETHRALATMLGLRRDRLEADLPDFDTGDVFNDARQKTASIDRVLQYANQFLEIQKRFGSISVRFEDLPLSVEVPVIDAGGTIYVGENLYQSNYQDLCGLPKSIDIARDGLDVVRDGYSVNAMIYVSYPYMKPVGVTDGYLCTGKTDEEVYRRVVENGSIRSNESNHLNYNFIDLDVGEKMYNTLLKEGVVGDVVCVINEITSEPEVDLVCNLDSLVVSTYAGKLVYRMYWNNDKYVDEWGEMKPLPNN